MESARRYNTTVQAIIAANPGINPNALRVGQIICLPSAGSCMGGTIYRIQTGDTLYGIAQRFGVNISRILNANPGLSTGSILYPGQLICIPIREI